jgi:hypothetical protein
MTSASTHMTWKLTERELVSLIGGATPRRESWRGWDGGLL